MNGTLLSGVERPTGEAYGRRLEVYGEKEDHDVEQNGRRLGSEGSTVAESAAASLLLGVQELNPSHNL